MKINILPHFRWTRALPFGNKVSRRNQIESELMDLSSKLHSEESYARKVVMTHRYAVLQKEYERRYGTQFDVQGRLGGNRESSLDDLVG